MLPKVSEDFDGVNLLLMTATISPQIGVPGLAISDPLMRRRHYESAVTRMLRDVGPGRPFSRLIFAENSGSDLSSIPGVVKRGGAVGRVELLSLPGDASDAIHGRGFGEFKLVDRAMESSESILARGPEVRIWKLTGRYALLNAKPIVSSFPPEADFYVDLKKYPMRWVDLRVFGFTKSGHASFAKGLYSALSEHADRVPPEMKLFEHWSVHTNRNRFHQRFRCEPLLSGVRGVDGKSYLNGVGVIKYVTRRIVRRFVPRLWI